MLFFFFYVMLLRALQNIAYMISWVSGYFRLAGR